MRPNFSEFQFAYGLTREIEGPVPGVGLIDLPRIPTQNQEATIPADMISTLQDGSKGLAPLFIQYKRPEKMVRSNAGEWDDLENRGVDLSDGYFRFSPYLGDNNQHNKLVYLGQEQPLTFYVTPAFIEHDEYREYATNEELFQNTAFIQCGNLRIINDENHYVTYTSMESRGIMLSEPTEFSVRSGTSEGVFGDEIREALSTFDQLRTEFNALREQVAFGFPEEIRQTGIGNPDRYRGEELTGWIRSQQQFFRETLGTDLLFFAEAD